MSNTARHDDLAGSRKSGFTTTHWSVVLAAATGPESPDAQEALEELCRTYWRPIYAFARHQGRNPEDSQDVTQGFFVWFLKRKLLTDVDRTKGKFRSFLLAYFKHFLGNEWQKRRAKKRGGDVIIVSIDDEEPVGGYQSLLTTDVTPETLYDKVWASTLIETAQNCLRDECKASGKEAVFETLQKFTTESDTGASYAEVAARLKMNESTLKVMTHRLRHRLRVLIKQEIARTVSTPSEVDGEMRYLYSVLSK